MTPKIVVPINPVAPGKGWPPPASMPESVLADTDWYALAERLRKMRNVNLSAQELITHNFRLTPGEPQFAEKVNYYLKTLVGCQNTSKDGRYYTFQGANPGLIFYPIAQVEQGTHVIIIGGVSVNESKHDAYPLNFIDPALRRGAAYGKNVHYIFFAPSYEKRVQNQKNEHNFVIIRRRMAHDKCPSGSWKHVTHWEKDPDHFLKTVQSAASSADHKVTVIRTRNELTTALTNIAKISTLEYYGHSDTDEFYLDYGIDGTSGSAQRWSDAQAATIPASKFTGSAYFASYGCHQGEDQGLAPALRRRWKIKTIGAEGKSNYEIIGDGESLFPNANNGYSLYPAPTKKSQGGYLYPPKEKIEKAKLEKP